MCSKSIGCEIIKEGINFGKPLYPKKPQWVIKALFLLYIFTIIIITPQMIRRIGMGSWFCASVQLFIISLLVCFLIFLPTGKLTILERGFNLSPSIFKEKYKGVPRYLKIEDIIAITPEYEGYIDRLKIINFKIYYDDGKFFTLPYKEVNKYMKIFKKNFPYELRKLYNRDYDIENINWQLIEQKIKLTDGKLLAYFLALGLIVFGITFVAFAAVVGSDRIFDDVLKIGWLFVCSLQVGIAAVQMVYRKKKNILLTLKRYIEINNINSVPLSITQLPQFEKWLKNMRKTKLKSNKRKFKRSEQAGDGPAQERRVRGGRR
jgi:hypothetical protein